MSTKFVAAILFLCASVSARDIRVAKDGSGDYKKLIDALEAAQEGDSITGLDLGRVGVEFQKSPEGFVVKNVLPGSAAQKAGIKPGDKIVLVEDQDISRLSAEEVGQRLGGRQGTTLRLHILHEGQTEAKRVDVVRAPATYKIYPNGPSFLYWSKIQIAHWFGDNEAAFAIAKRGAAAGDVASEGQLMRAYLYGQGTAKDEKQAVRWAKTAADGGSMSAQFWYGFQLLTGSSKLIKQDQAAAARYIRPAAEHGDVEAQRLWGWMLTEGNGVAKDLAEGIRWSKQAAEAGSFPAMYHLGRDYEYGLGVARDGTEAGAWYGKALASAEPAIRKLAQEGLDRLRAPSSAASPAAPPPAPAPTPSRDEIKAMLAEALREQSASKSAAEVPPEKKSDVDAPSYSRKQRPDDVAVVIGIEKYENLPAASYAERDAQAVRAHLVALGYAERNIFSLIGPQATKSAFTKELEARLHRLVKPDSTVFVYYSGHGAPDTKSGAAYLVPYDGDPEFLEETAYPLRRLYAKLGALKAKRVIVALDSCFSGAGGRSVLAKGVRPLVSKVEAVEPVGPVAALTAASGGEISGALDEQGHGLFTYYLLKGLNDGDMTLGALHGYLKTHVEDEARRHNRDQTPQLIGAGADETPLDK